MTKQEIIETFKEHGIPGMRLMAPVRHRVPSTKPLVKRCESCNVVISANKMRCGMCQQLVWSQLAAEIGEDRDLFESFLQRNCPDVFERKAMIRNMRPYLKFHLE